MTDLSEVLARLGLSQYLGRLTEEGFEKWETVLDITEQDLATLNFKLGHRRILQREIASARGVPPNQALTPYPYYPPEEVEVDEKSSPKPNKAETTKAPAPTGKRKYRRHPKPDEHAPEKPPSAYVMFANRVRDELKGRNLSFTDIAKLVGEKWKVLDPEHKESYEFEASVAKDRYNSELQEYKKTDSYREYVQYLSEFKSKAAKEGREGSEQLDALRKRPKLESIPSSGSGGTSYTASSAASVTSGINTPATSMSIGKSGSIAAGTTPSLTEYSAYSSPSGPNSVVNPSSTHSAPVSTTTSTPISPTPPPRISPDVARYRDTIARTTQQQQETLTAQSIDSEPSFFSRIHPTVQSPHIQQQSSYMRHQPHSIGAQPPLPRSGPSLSSPMLRRPSVRLEEISQMLTSTSNSGNSSAPSATPLTPTVHSFDDVSRSHRSLPSLPPPTPGASSGGNYFDRPHHQPPPRSPRSFSHHKPFPPPSSLAHPSHSYSHSSSSQSLSSNQLNTDTPNTAASTLPSSSHPPLPHEKKPPS